MGLVGVIKTEVAMLTFEHFSHYPMVATRPNKGVCHFDVASCHFCALVWPSGTLGLRKKRKEVV